MPGPKVSREMCVDLWYLLADGQYHHRRDIPISPRLVRAICQSKPEFFLSSQKGYKRTDKCSDQEIEEAVADLRSRARKIDQRADALESVIQARRMNRLV